MTVRRKNRGERERARLFALHDGRCHICGQKIQGGYERWELEHVIPLELGGEDDDENTRPAHEACHREKTAKDVAQIRKAQRLERRTQGIGKTVQRPLPGGRGSRWKKKVSGEVVER